MGSGPSLFFGEFELHPKAKRLFRGGEEVALPPRVLSILEVFLSRPGELITRDELVDDAWAGTAVTDGSISEAIHQLRKALDDNSKSPRFIQTVHSRGYRFDGTVEPNATSASLARLRD
jgi:DNA-binding winged helix-turn-helix (wHTH) protein